MVNFKRFVLTAIVSSFIGASALAGDDISLGQPSYGGSGCPDGTASAVLSPDKKTLSVLFDDYIVEAGGATRKRIARKSCNIAIPVHVPQGYSISLFKIDYRGYTYVPRGAMARFNVEYFFAGARGPRYSKTFRGYTDNDYMLTNNLAAESLVWSRCGADVNLRVNSSMMTRSNRWKDDVLATVDSADVETGIVYHIQWKRCR